MSELVTIVFSSLALTISLISMAITFARGKAKGYPYSRDDSSLSSRPNGPIGTVVGLPVATERIQAGQLVAINTATKTVEPVKPPAKPKSKVRATGPRRAK